MNAIDTKTNNHTKIRFGVFTHTHATARAPGKYFSVGPDGKLAVEKVGGALTQSQYATAQIDSLQGLATWLERDALPTQHLTAGVSEHPKAMVVPRDKEHEYHEHAVLIGRTNSDLPFRAEPGLMTIDSDSKGQPVTMDGVWQALCEVCPALISYSILQCTSSSSLISLNGTDTGISGLHGFYHVADATDIPRALDVLHVRLCLAGHHRHKPSETGKFLARSLVDLALKKPSQPIYVRAHVTPPIEQRKQVYLRQGMIPILNTRNVITDLTEAEHKAYTQHCKEAEAAMRPELERVRAAYVERRTTEISERQGVSREQAKTMIESAMGSQFLMADWPIKVRNEWISVGQILAEPEVWHGVACHDPLDPSYGGASTAKIFSNQGQPMITSFAHSGGDKGTNYKLMPMPTANPSQLPQGATPVPAGGLPGVPVPDVVVMPPVVPVITAGPSKRATDIADRINRAIGAIVENAPTVDAACVDRIVQNVVYSGTKNKLMFAQHGGGWVTYNRPDAWRMMCRRFGTPIDIGVVTGLIPAGTTQTDRDRMVKSIRQAIVGTIEDELMFANQRERLQWLVDPFATETSVKIGEVFATITLPHVPYVESAFDQNHIDDFRHHFPEFDELLRWLVACRFCDDRKQSYLWLLAASNFGKGLIFGLLKNLGAVVSMSVKEIKSALEGKPLGKSPEDFTRAIILWVDEFKTVKSELKQIQNEIEISPKFGLQSTVQIYAKVFTSAEEVKSLTGERGVERQFINRIALLTNDNDVRVRPTYIMDQVAYARSLAGYMAQMLNRHFAEFVALGRDNAARKAQAETDTFIKTHSISNEFASLDDGLKSLAKDFHRYLFKNQSALEQADHIVLSKDDRIPHLCHPAKVLEDYLRDNVGQDELRTIMRRSSDIMKHISADGTGSGRYTVYNHTYYCVRLHCSDWSKLQGGFG